MSQKKLTCLQKNILATLAYYRVLKWPLSLFEVYRYLVCFKKVEDFSLVDIQESLNLLVDNNLVSSQKGFYFLKENDKLQERRVQREKQALKKWILLKKRCSVLQNVPFLRAAFISGSVAVGNTYKQSDLDLLIVAQEERIWTVRAFLHFTLGILGWRRREGKVEDKICLNHFLTTANLKVPFENMYNAQTYAHLLPLIDQGKFLRRFKKSNSWIEDYIYHPSLIEEEARKEDFFARQNLVQRFLEFLFRGFIGNSLEVIFSWAQRKKISLHQSKKEDERIFVGKNQLAFHPRMREKKIVSKYKENLREIGLLEV